MLQVLSEPCGPPSSDSEREGSPRICATAGPRAFLNRSTTSGPAQRNHLFCNLDWAFNVSAAPCEAKAPCGRGASTTSTPLPHHQAGNDTQEHSAALPPSTSKPCQAGTSSRGNQAAMVRSRVDLP